MDYRIEKDTLGEVKVPKDSLWGAQTERSKKNFKIGNPSSMPIEIIHAYAILKKSAAAANQGLGVLSKEKSKLIQTVCDEILSNKHKLHGWCPSIYSIKYAEIIAIRLNRKIIFK